jgi:flagellar motor switch protein FliN/FliY
VLQRIWIDCFRAVLSQVAGFPVTVEPAEPNPASAEAEQGKPPVWMIFSASKALKGEMAILTDETGALPLAQILVSEPPDPAVPFDKDHRDAYEELLRQVLGQVATGLKSVAGGEVEIKPAGNDAPEWQGATRLGIRIAGEKFEPVHLTLVATRDLLKSLQPPAKPDEPPTPRVEQPVPASPELSPSRNSNLELLLGVKLDATIRFGQKQMLLREVLDLHPGTAVALDRQVEEPVELLVGGRTVARGEVVIVDGNYGLRITEILSPQQRIESLRN